MLTWCDFPDDARPVWVAADTETRLYVDGELVTTAQLEKMATPETPLKWWRDHVTVHCYAWLISDGIHTACFDTFDAFNTFLTDHCVYSVWWYNAKFDFAQIDYAILSSGWTCTTGKLTADHTYTSLHGRQGQRYSLALATTRHERQNREHVHVTRHFDFCNIIGGGLAKCLESFDVCDFDGRPVRKLSMDYQGDDEATARVYMENDVIGLYHLIRTADAFIYDTFGYRIAGRKPDVMTAGALAKKVMLRFYGGGTDRENLKTFQLFHPMTPHGDAYYRETGLYRGGITFVNPIYQNKPLRGKIYKYDVNSMYPYNMARMPDIIGVPYEITPEQYEREKGRTDRVFILELERVRGCVRRGMLPFWYDVDTMSYIAQVDQNAPLLMFDFEFTELCRWYDFDDVEIKRVLCFRAMSSAQYTAFVNFAYAMKRDAKKSKNAVQEAFAKLLLNSAYGKLSENPRRAQSHRELNPDTGAVVLVDDPTEIDTSTTLNVVQGACVTALSRCTLLTYIRETCPVPARDFIYCDTDSIHAFTQYPNPDAYTLGALKDETAIDGRPVPYSFAVYLAPKTYLLYRCYKGKRQTEIHTKGVPKDAVLYDAAAGRVGSRFIKPTDTPATLSKKFAAGVKFKTLAAMNVRGGKALVPYYKYLCRPDNTVAVDALLFIDF